MFRRLFLALLGAVVIACGITACTTPTMPTSPKANTYITPPSDAPTATTMSDKPQETPPVVANALIPYTAVALDTTGFDRPASVDDWWLGEKHDYVMVTIGLSKKDWLVIASQLHLDPATDPSRLQLDQTTAASLIDVDQLAEKVIKNCQNYHVPVVDIRQLHEGYYSLTVDN